MPKRKTLPKLVHVRNPHHPRRERCCDPCKPHKPSKIQKAIEKLLAIIFDSRFNPNELRLAVSSIAEDDSPNPQHTKMNIELNALKKRLLKLSATRDDGKPAKIDGPIRFSIEEGEGSIRLHDQTAEDIPAEGTVLVLPSPSGKKVSIIALEDTSEEPAPKRRVVVRATADANLDQDVTEPITLDLEIDVLSSRASNIDAVEVGDEEDADVENEVNPEDDAAPAAKSKK